MATLWVLLVIGVVGVVGLGFERFAMRSPKAGLGVPDLLSGIIDIVASAFLGC